jgi:hypothetical protein
MEKRDKLTKLCLEFKEFIAKLYKKAVEKNDERMVAFCQEIFDVYERYQINGHIKRPDQDR